RTEIEDRARWHAVAALPRRRAVRWSRGPRKYGTRRSGGTDHEHSQRRAGGSPSRLDVGGRGQAGELRLVEQGLVALLGECVVPRRPVGQRVALALGLGFQLCQRRVRAGGLDGRLEVVFCTLPVLCRSRCLALEQQGLDVRLTLGPRGAGLGLVEL